MKINDYDVLLKIICYGTAFVFAVGLAFNIEDPWSIIVLPAILWLIMTPHMMRTPGRGDSKEES